MKPRQVSAPATVEDLDIWLRLLQRWRRRYASKAMARFDLDAYAPDRRDADVMLGLLAEGLEYGNPPIERCLCCRWWEL
jgi:hypothetical protein